MREFHIWFEEFCSKPENQEAVGEELAEYAWDAARNKIIKILKTQTEILNLDELSQETSTLTTIPLDVINKIEQL